MRQKLSTLRAKLNAAGKENKGFTLVELIVVIVILAILVGVTIGGVYGYVNKSRINTDINNASAIASALAPVTTNKNVTVSSDTKVISTAITSTDMSCTSLGLSWADPGDGSVDPAKAMFPDGIAAPKTGGSYKITYTKDTDNRVLSVSVVAYSDTSATAGKELKAQE